MAFIFDETQIRRTLSLVKPDNALFEIRFISGKWNASGYFTSADKFLEELRKFHPRTGANCYLLLNSIKDDCYSRQQKDRIVEMASPTTGDGDVDGLDWIMVDLDPKRASGTSSSGEQLEYAHKKANEIFEFLRQRGFSDPIVGMSGNGYHLLYKVYMKNSEENVKRIENFLKVLDMFFSDESIDVDLKTFNPARICKLYGTMAQKGSNTSERPHRMSGIVYEPNELDITDVMFIDKMNLLLPQEEQPQRYNNFNPKQFDLQSWIDSHGIRVSEKTSWQGGFKWILEECPFNPEHKGKDASIVQTADGKICYNCFHNSCSGNHWKEFRQLYEPDAYERKSAIIPATPNYIREREKNTAIQATQDAPIFETTEQIRNKPTPPKEFLPSGISEIDKKMGGLQKGFVTVISGLRAAGKSSLISQMTLSCRNNGYRVALYSGELTDKNVLEWLTLQGAGRANTHATAQEDKYAVDDGIDELVSKWLDEYVFVYNNDYGNDYDVIKMSLEKCVAENKVDLIILDNLMALNIERLDQDKYLRQSKFVGELEEMAKRCNIHIIFIAHPRKSQGFLRLDDVSGSNDIVNRVDNAFIIHRVNNDFKRLSKEMFGWEDNHSCYLCSNVIEICKDRDGGKQDIFIPLYFEVETKRLKNTKDEFLHYGWENNYGNLKEVPEYVINAADEQNFEVVEFVDVTDETADEEMPWQYYESEGE